MIKNLKIPEERMGVLKACISEMERGAGVKIAAGNSDVKIDGEPIHVWKAKDLVKAIGRGFSPEKAMQLLDDKKMLCIINLKDYENTDKGLKRIKGRLIGRDGKTREKIEEITGCFISVYGKTVSIIAEGDKMSSVREGIEMLINGYKHNKVYRYFQRCFGD